MKLLYGAEETDDDVRALILSAYTPDVSIEEGAVLSF